MSWALAMNDGDGLERATSDRYLAIRRNQLQCRNSSARCRSTINGVLPALSQLIRRRLTCTDRQNGILRIGISAQLINPTGVINMNMGHQRAIESGDAVAQRLLA